MSIAVIIAIVGSIISVLTFLGAVFAVGWKLHGQLSDIKTMIKVFVEKAEGKWELMDRIEKRVEKLEDKPLCGCK